MAGVARPARQNPGLNRLCPFVGVPLVGVWAGWQDALKPG